MKKLKLQLTIDIVIGVLMMLPLINYLFPNNVFQTNTGANNEAIRLITGLIVWTGFSIWFIRLRKIKDIGICVAVLSLAGGLVTTTLLISSYFGLGIVSIALACSLPYIYSGFHVNRLLKLTDKNMIL